MLSPVSAEEDTGLGAFIIVIIICTGGGLGGGIGLLMNLDLAVLSLIYTHFTVTPAKLGCPPPLQFFLVNLSVLEILFVLYIIDITL